MILQALYEYYQRKAADPDSKIAPEGFEWKELPYIVVIDEKGKLKALECTLDGEGKKKRARSFLLPQGVKRASGISANLLWDNIEYALGAGASQAKHDAFKARIANDLTACKTAPQLTALDSFFKNNPMQQLETLLPKEELEAFLEKKPFITFRIQGTDGTIIDSLRDSIANAASGSADADEAVCLVSGIKDEIERLHPSIKGVRGTNTVGGSIVAFNSPAFCSYGKEQSFNAPTGKKATFAYATALNVLLGKDSQNKCFSGDSSIIFWSKKKDQNYDLEDDMAFFFEAPKDDPDKAVLAVRNLYNAVNSGILSVEDDNQFYVLGLAPNAARISIRFWKCGTVASFADKIKQHFDDTSITKGEKSKEPDFYALNQLLRATALEYKTENIPPNLAGSVIESVLDGTPYPITLMQQCVRRIRAEQNVTRTRASILKAYLNRKNRFYNKNQKEEFTVSLDKSNTSPAYRLGRLFAVLEKIQEEANPGINATIRERFYGAASSTPITVFPQLLKLKNHHIAKLSNPAAKISKEKLLGEIIDGIKNIPPHLSMEEQAEFAIGYYHQRQALFESTSKNEK